ncbi:conjugal transfer protein TraB [Streptomyces sp. S816]|uniref:conjugal transfer protein TraB n=1 Tax=Streptomyces sp. S816 TaxID=2283197 RepID=UPI00109C6F81|nr:conjugal transfer protein TraB [Streptomyces sp. S816]TGZ12382.1 conjugal transfer protein TraB [Streptomyces sp. S816]
MSSDLAPRNTSSTVPAGDDNRFKTTQAKLKKLAAVMDDAAIELHALRRSMRADASYVDGVATDIEHADLDSKFVALTENVSCALAGAAVEMNTLAVMAQETADLTHQTRRTHAKLYGATDDIRSNRREKTPKPGFFNR